MLGDLPLERPTAMMDVESLVGIASMLDGWLPDVCQGVAPLVVTFVGLSMRPSTTHVSLEALEPVFARIEDIVTQQVRQRRCALWSPCTASINAVLHHRASRFHTASAAS